MPKVLDPEPGPAIAVAITVQTTLTDRRSIVMQTYIPRDAPVVEFHDALDKLGKAIDRQDAKYRLDALLVTMEAHEKTLHQLEEDFNRIDTDASAAWLKRGKKGEPELSANERAQKGNAKQNILRYRMEIKKLQADIDQCKATIAKVD